MKTTFALLPLAFVAAVASAAPADDMSRVEVTGQPARVERFDVRQACAKIDVRLANRLSGTWYQEQPVGTMTVQFQLNGEEVSEVKTSGFNLAYMQTRRAVRNAVMALDCKADAAGQQNYAFQIVFEKPSEDGGAERFAITEMRVASR